MIFLDRGDVGIIMIILENNLSSIGGWSHRFEIETKIVDDT